MSVELTSTVNGVTYCVFCLKELQDAEHCDCKATQKAIAAAAQKAAHKALPKHNHDRPPRKTDK